MKIIDSHAHLGAGKDEKDLFQYMNQNSISHSILIGWEMGSDVSKTENIVRVASENKNITAVAGLQLVNGEKNTVDKIRELAINKKISGVKIHLGYEHIFANNKACYQVAEVCADMRIPLLFHTGDVWTKTEGLKSAKVRFAHPIYIDDLATDMPDLNIIICHFGNPWMIDAAEVMYKNENVYADLSALDIEKPTGMMCNRIKEAVEYSDSPHKFLFGTDFPLFPADIQMETVRSLPVDQEATFHKNAEKLFKLS